MKYIFIAVFLVACSNNQNTSIPGNHRFAVSDTVIGQITKECITHFEKAKICAIISSRMMYSTMLYLAPVYDNEHLKSGNYPTTYYEDNGILFLVYSGLEKLQSDTILNKDFKSKYDSVCLKYNIKEAHAVHDDPPLFFKIVGSSLVPFYNQHFYENFMEIELDKTKFISPKIVAD